MTDRLTPFADPRPFAEVLRDWLARHRLPQTDGTAARFGAHRRGLQKWLAGHPCPAERSHRALMTLVDEGRA